MLKWSFVHQPAMACVCETNNKSDSYREKNIILTLDSTRDKVTDISSLTRSCSASRETDCRQTGQSAQAPPKLRFYSNKTNQVSFEKCPTRKQCDQIQRNFATLAKRIGFFDKILTAYFLFGKMLSLLWQIWYIFGLICMLANSKY